MDPLVEIRRADPASADVSALIATHIAYGNAHYRAESNHHLTPMETEAEGVMLWACWQGDACVGMIGLKPFGDTEGELKSMHVLPQARGTRVAQALLERVFDEARALEITQISLETGSRDASAAARLLYERAGFTYCLPFGEYVADPESVFMTRAL